MLSVHISGLLVLKKCEKLIFCSSFTHLLIYKYKYIFFIFMFFNVGRFMLNYFCTLFIWCYRSINYRLINGCDFTILPFNILGGSLFFFFTYKAENILLRSIKNHCLGNCLSCNSLTCILPHWQTPRSLQKRSQESKSCCLLYLCNFVAWSVHLDIQLISDLVDCVQSYTV